MENNSKLFHGELTQKIIGCAAAVHKELGPGLLESAYEACFACEMQCQEIRYGRQTVLPVRYREIDVDCGYRMDFLIEDKVIVELKASAKILAISMAQLMTYLKLSKVRVGLLINFNVPFLTDSIIRVAV